MAERKTHCCAGGILDITLNKLNNVDFVKYNGKYGVFIPIEENGIYLSDKGTAVISFFMSKMKKTKWGRTHSLRRRLTRIELEMIPTEEREKVPVCGYFKPFLTSYNTNPENNDSCQKETRVGRNNKIEKNKSEVDMSLLPF